MNVNFNSNPYQTSQKQNINFSAIKTKPINQARLKKLLDMLNYKHPSLGPTGAAGHLNPYCQELYRGVLFNNDGLTEVFYGPKDRALVGEKGKILDNLIMQSQTSGDNTVTTETQNIKNSGLLDLMKNLAIDAKEKTLETIESMIAKLENASPKNKQKVVNEIMTELFN